MVRTILHIIIIQIAVLPALGQAPLVKDTLYTLNQPEEVVHRYVNFDVVKIMLTRGAAIHLPAPNAGNLSINLQYLYPYSKFKEVFPVAIGGTAGYDKIAIRGRQFVFSNNKLDTIIVNDDIQKSKVWWFHAGLVVAPIIRLNRITLLPGASFNINFAGRMKEKTVDKDKTTSRVKQLKWFSMPLFLQVSLSKKQFASCGVFANIYRNPVPTDNSFKKLTQLNIGLTGALIF